MASTLMTDILRLSVSERILLVQDIWDSIAAESAVLELSDEQREELDRRLDALESQPNVGIPWDGVKSRLLNRG